MKPIVFRGGGDIATGSIYRLVKAGYPVIVLEIAKPSAIRREVAFCQAVYDGKTTVEDMDCTLVSTPEEALLSASSGAPVLLVDPECDILKLYHPWLLVDGILAKRNLGTTRDMADVVVGLGPGFTAGVDVDYVIETMRGHNLSRIITEGGALPDTGTPGIIAGYGKERVIHAPAAGRVHCIHHIGDSVEEGEPIAMITGEDGKETPVPASLTGILRGIINEGYIVPYGLKMADIDPRYSEQKNCFTISDKARAIGGSVLELAVAAEHGILPVKKK